MARLRLLLQFACLLLALAAMTGTAAADTATGDPSANLTLSQDTQQACQADPSSSACVSDALADINAAHAAEGVEAMSLPSDWNSLTVPQQLLVVSDLERTERGLIPALGLSAPLDSDATNAANNDEDPMPTNFYGDYATSNWAGGYPSPLEADFVWMYDDGYGSGNQDCTAPGASGCWGHRKDILATFDSPLVMGAGYGTAAYGPSMTELFVGGDQETGSGQPDAPLDPTWATISAFLPGGSGGSSSASGTLAQTAIATGASTSPRVTKASTHRRSKLTARLMRRVVRRGRVARVIGAASGQPGRSVWLEYRRGTQWVPIATARTGRTGHFSLRFTAAAAGAWRLRVVRQSAAGVSRVLSLRVSA